MRGLTGSALAAAATLLSYVVVHEPRAAHVDRRLAERLATPRGDAADRVIAAATDLGSVYALGGASAALVSLGRPRLALDVLGAGMTAWGIAQGAKPLAGRDRPYQADGSHRLVAEPAGSSWPSGHVAVAAAVGTVAADHGGVGARALAAGLAVFVGFSRVYVGVHYPSDAVGGIGLGHLSARAWKRGSARARRWRNRN